MTPTPHICDDRLIIS